MSIQKLNVMDIRNLKSISFQPSPVINLFVGLNGSGKTSILEAIHMLALARSFRTSKIKPVIRAGHEKYTIFGVIDSFKYASSLSVGVSRGLYDAMSQIRVAGEVVKSSSELARLIPIQVINPDTFRLLEGSPKLRRGFMDWGLFHVKHKVFFPAWKRMQKALKQRNHLLRHGRVTSAEISPWNHEFIQAALLIDKLRYSYIDQLLPYFNQMLKALCRLDQVKINYYRGWDKDQELSTILDKGLAKDTLSGYTHSGPQRADLRVKVGKINALDRLSRGQIKLLVCALKLAQGHLLSDVTGNKCIFLIDDLVSELDIRHQRALCHLLQEMKNQVFITCVEEKALADFWLPNIDYKVFHVKQGTVT